MDTRIEAYLDGGLPPVERRRFERGLREQPAWKNELARARRLRTELHALPTPACPPAVTQAVLAGTQQRPDRLPRSRRATRQARRWRPLAAAAVLLLAVALAPLVSPPPGESARYSETEIRRAAAEVEWTFALLAHVGRQTGRTVRHDVLETHVAEPLHEALRAALFEPNHPDHENNG